MPEPRKGARVAMALVAALCTGAAGLAAQQQQSDSQATSQRSDSSQMQQPSANKPQHGPDTLVNRVNGQQNNQPSGQYGQQQQPGQQGQSNANKPQHGPDTLANRIKQNPSQQNQASSSRNRIPFAADKTDLSDSAKALLDQRVAIFRANPSMRVVIMTAGTKMEASDSSMAMQRADAVKSYLVDKGVDAKRIQVASNTHGKSNTQQGQHQYVLWVVSESSSQTHP